VEGLRNAVDVTVLAGLGTVTIMVFVSFLWRYRAPAGRVTGRGAWFFSIPGWARTLLILVAIPLTVYVTRLLWIPLPLSALSSGLDGGLRLAGLVVNLAGAALIVWGRLALGRAWTVTTSLGVQLHEDHRLVQHGPFALVRHPMYLGFWLLLAGALFIYRTWVLAVYLIMALASFSRRARREEQALAEAFGDEWRTYADRVGRWVPNVPKGGFGHGW
jgi:protein-S-isoprenylcysteine O-methyltransferase Ste14